VELEGTVLIHHCVSGVVTAGVARDYGSALRKEIYDLPFAFITPLGSNNSKRGHGLRTPIIN
jgi:hypothetical protein